MSGRTNGKRLDEILLGRGKITEDQVRVALKHQKSFGGKFGSHLLHHGFVNETELVEALAEHFGCEGVSLSGRQIPDSVLHLVPANLAFARRVVPFDYDPDHNLLRIACENPDDEALLGELKRFVPGRDIRLCVAVEIALNLSINRHYSGENAATDWRPDRPASMRSSSALPEAQSGEDRRVLVVTPDDACGKVLKAILERDGLTVTLCANARQALSAIGEQPARAALIDTNSDDGGTEIARHLSEISERTQVRFFGSLTDLIISGADEVSPHDPLFQTVELFACLLIVKDRLPRMRSCRVTHYVGKLCDMLELLPEDRNAVLEASRLLEYTKAYLVSSSPRDIRRLTELSSRLLQAFYFQPVVPEILKAVAFPMSGDPPGSVDLADLGGNILTAVELFGDLVTPNQRLTRLMIEDIEVNLRRQVGVRLYPRVFEAFMAMITEEAVGEPVFSKTAQVMIFSERPEDIRQLEDKLTAEGFRIITASDLKHLVSLYRRSQPEMLLLDLACPAREIIARINELVVHGVDLSGVPTFLRTASDQVAQSASLLGQGIEDILSHETGLDMIVLKLRKAWEQQRVAHDGAAGRAIRADDSHGRLSDMNMIDLLQALGPSGRTARVRVRPNAGSDDELEIHLDRGNIAYARLGDITGAEAIYLGIPWNEGSWSVEPLAHEQLAEQNTFVTNELILIEGCRIKDEMTRHQFHT